MKTPSKWRRRTAPFGSVNYVLEGDGFYISFNPDTSSSAFGRIFESNNGSPETALCKDDDFHILNGDYRSQYEKLIQKGWVACKKFYDKESVASGSDWSVAQTPLTTTE